MSAPSYWREKVYRYRLIATYCENCNKKFYPPRPICLYCNNQNLKEVKLPNTGTLLEYTQVFQTFPEFSKLAPYYLGLIKLDDGTIIVAQLTDVERSELKEGIRVEAVFRKMYEDGEAGLIYYGIKFRPLA
ncbi:MAG: Zn-ribbon domain-containing OB-fold protein [Thermoproteota archaeon]|jgi:uncharacterized OB-fold protein|nr:Zn-ribbon domain-containing OB-fold protein [Thermoproteota archaeon]